MSSASEPVSHNTGFDNIELVGEKIKLRPTSTADASLAYSLLTAEPDFTRYMPWSGPKSVAEPAETYGTRWPEEMHSGKGYALALEENGKQGIIGSIHLRPTNYPGQFDFGYWLGKTYWNRGYMAEALGLVCYFGFEHLHAEVILGSAFVGNLSSKRVMEKNGFKIEGTLRRSVRKGDCWFDLWHFSLLREEWQRYAIKPAYEKFIPNKVLPSVEIGKSS